MVQQRYVTRFLGHGVHGTLKVDVDYPFHLSSMPNHAMQNGPSCLEKGPELCLFRLIYGCMGER